MKSIKILEIAHLIEVLKSDDWTTEHKIEHLKMCRENKWITANEAIDLAIEYHDDIMKGSDNDAGE